MFPTLEPAEVERMRRFGTLCSYADGEALVRVGQTGHGMTVILSGEVIITGRDLIGAPEAIVTHRAGNFMGELAQLTGRPSLVDAHANGAVEALIIPPERLRALLVAEAELGERIMRALILRRVGLLETGAGGPVIIGPAGNGDVLRLEGFLARNGQRVKVDFERLFQRGDLSQNVPLEPGDYLYFASASGNEIYVLGEVMMPGAMIYNSSPTVVNAIATRGGYTTRAFKSRVLVVRGSLEHPQTFVIDTADILHGKAKDFALEPHDIVYVSMNPWVIAGEVLDVAAKSFVQAVVIQGTTLKIPPANW